MKRLFYRRKSGQVELSFGMIFSIILIIAFVAFTVYGIFKFLEFRDSAQVLDFERNFQVHIKTKWAGTEGTENHEYILPEKIKSVCFINNKGRITADSEMKKEIELMNLDDEANLFFSPRDSAGDEGSTKIDYLNIEDITKLENPYCISTKNGRLKLTIQKSYGESSVRVFGQ